METKLDSRQAQFPATFPDTFKNFFEMMNEDEDHIDIFSNLLEDKVIPRASNNNMFAQRRCGGSLRCSTHPHSNGGSSSSDMTSESLGGGMNTNTIRLDGRSSGGGSGGGGGILVGRSNSFRINRARNSFCATGLNKIGIVGEDSARCSGIGRGGGGGGEECCDAVGDGGGGGGGGIGSSLFCKHIKYCCLHQHSTQQQQQPSTHKSSSQQLYMQQQQQRYHQQQQQQQQKQQQPHNFNQKNYYDFSSNVVGTSHHASNNSIALGSSATRLGPDGEDIESNGGGGGNSGGITGDTNSGPAVKKSLLLLSDMTAAIKIRFQKQQTQTKTQTQQHQHQQQEEKQQLQKRHSVILERAFDFDVSCDESDTLSIQSPTTTGKLLNATVATAKAPQSAPATTYSVLKPILMHSQQQQQQQLPTEAPPPPHPPPMQGLPTHMHRLLPQPPKNFGVGAFHTKETALQRVQQQSGLLSNATSKVNLQGCLHHASTSAEASATQQQQQQQAHYNDTMSNDFSSNYSNYQMDALHSPTAAPPPPLPLPPPTTTTRHLPHHQQQQQQQQQLVTGSVDASLLNAAHCSSSRTALSSIRCQKSPILHRRRSSSIAANLLHAGHGYTHSSSSNIADDFGKHGDDSMRDRITMAKSPVSRFNMNSMMQLPIPVESGVLTFQQALSGAVSPQYSVTSPFLQMGAIGGNRSTTATEPGEGVVNVGIGSISNRNISEIAGSCTALASVLEDTNTSGPDVSDDSPNGCDAPLSTGELHPLAGQFSSQQQQQQQQQQRGERGEAAGIPEHGSSVTVSHLGNRQRQRMRTSSMPAENRKPRLVDTRRAAIHCADIDMEYYRLRSFSITSHGVCHLGDSLRSRRSRSINSVTSTGTSNSGVDRHNSNASRTSDDVLLVPGDGAGHQTEIPAYKIAMLGGSGVGKTTLTYQFTTSDYICAYDLSLDDDYGQKTVSVLVDNIETDLEIIDHPSCEMSTEAFCSTYNIDLFVVVYSVVDRSTFKAAEKVLHYLKENEMLLTRGAILVGNKTDLERHREVTRQMGRKVAKEIACKFIETSSGLDHNVDELLVGIVAQVKLNPQRIRNLSERDQQRLNLQSTIQKHRRMHTPQRRIVRQMSMFQDDDDADHDVATASTSAAAAAAAAPDTSCANVCDKATAMHANDSSTASITATVAANVAKLHRGGVVRKPHRRTLNLESILKMGESELEDEEEAQRLQMQGLRAITKFELLTSGIKPPYTFARARTALSTPQNNANPSNNESTSESTTDALLGAVGGSGSDGSNSGTVRGHKTMTRLTTRTKILLSSVLRFKRAILIKRRNSSSCSDLFVI